MGQPFMHPLEEVVIQMRHKHAFLHPGGEIEQHGRDAGSAAIVGYVVTDDVVTVLGIGGQYQSAVTVSTPFLLGHGSGQAKWLAAHGEALGGLNPLLIGAIRSKSGSKQTSKQQVGAFSALS